MNKTRLCLALALGGLIAAQPVLADEREQLEVLRQTTIAMIDALVDKGILTRDAADELLRKAEETGKQKALEYAMAPASVEDKATVAAAVEPGVVRVPYIPQTVRDEIKEQLRQEIVAEAKTDRWGDVNAVPEWVGRLKWYGDFRLRGERDLFANDNDPAYSFYPELDNTTVDQNRTRLRLRLGMDAKITDDVSAGFRITTGSTTNPVSTNQTLGGTSGNKYSVVLDRAYLKAQLADSLSVSGGLMPNPFLSSSLVWDDDLNFAGLAATFKAWPNGTQDAKPFLTFGAFPLDNVSPSESNKARNKWLYAGQLGLNWKLSPYSQWRFGLAYYDYVNVKGRQNPYGQTIYDGTAPAYRQRGNSLTDISYDGSGTWALASDFKLVNLTAMADLSHFDPVHVILSADVVRNIGYDEKEVAGRAVDETTGTTNSDYAKRTFGWQSQITVGYADMDLPGNWQVFGGYRYVQRDAVLDAYTDSDFNLGGTNAKGYFLGGSYGLDRNTWLTARWLSGNSIDGLSYGVDVLQVDLNAKF